MQRYMGLNACSVLTGHKCVAQFLKMDPSQPIYDSIDDIVSPDSSGIYYKSMLADTLLEPGAEGGYQQTSTYTRVSGSHCKGQLLRVLRLKSLKILLFVLCVLSVLSLTVAFVSIVLGSSSWSRILNQQRYVNPSMEERIANLSNLLDTEVSDLKEQDDFLRQKLFQVSQIYETCHHEVTNCSINLPLQYRLQESCMTNPVFPIHKEVSMVLYCTIKQQACM